MQKSSLSSRHPSAILLPLSVLGLLLAYTYVLLFKAPYCGFSYNPSSGIIGDIDIPGATLQMGDVLEQIGPVSWAQYFTNPTLTLFENVQPGQIVDITVQRDGSSLTIPWVFPGINKRGFLTRFFNLWWLAYFFWFFGMIVQLFMRPKDARWRLLVAANYLTAFWLIFGSLSTWQIWRSSLLLHAVTWLMMPVYLSFHWIFPRPLGKVPLYASVILYSFGAVLAVGQFLNLIPASFYLLGFLLLLIGSIILLVIHFVKQADHRRETGLLVIALLIAVFPSISLALSGIFGSIPRMGSLALLALPLMPGAYFYAAYRRQLGGMELRANRVIALIIYGVLLLSLTIPAAFVINLAFTDPGTAVTLGLSFTLLLCLVTALVYPNYQRWVERRWLGMPLPPAHVLEAYMARITTSLEREQLSRVICDEILPSLLIRQAALLRLEDGHRFIPICTLGINPDQLPQPGELPSLLAESGKIRSSIPGEAVDRLCPWAYLVLSLTLDGKPIGLCLFGRRDPDDFYAASEIPTLQALMDQSALAIINIEQSERLHALYKADIERQEAERSRLAFELHDDVLGQMALLAMNVRESNAEPKFNEAYQSATERIRQIISGLRPTMLNYGLWSALDELVDGIKTSGTGISIQLEVPADKIRHPQTVELHLFRIIQQACQNAMQHSHARTIRITGSLQPDLVNLVVEDDGVGFTTGQQLDLAGLLANKHFGLAGMYERAALIGAKMTIESEPGRRTRVRVTWQPDGMDLKTPVS